MGIWWLGLTRLVAFGCSFASGHGIADTWDTVTQQHLNNNSRHAWVETLGKLLNIDVINNANSGTSNKEISYAVQNFKFKLNDIAIINWTFRERSCIIGIDDKNHQLSVHDTDPIGAAWTVEHVNHRNMTYESIMAVSTAEWVLEKQHVMHRHLFLKEFIWEGDDRYIQWLGPNVIPVQFDYKKGNKGCDGSHPNLAAYTEYAHEVHNWIKENEDINKW